MTEVKRYAEQAEYILTELHRCNWDKEKVREVIELKIKAAIEAKEEENDVEICSGCQRKRVVGEYCFGCAFDSSHKAYLAAESRLAECLKALEKIVEFVEHDSTWISDRIHEICEQTLDALRLADAKKEER